MSASSVFHGRNGAERRRKAAQGASPAGISRIAEGVMTVRPCATTDEMRAAFAPIWHYFGQSAPSEMR
jgi:hypothetical protein